MTKEEAKEVFLNRGFVNGIFDGDMWRKSCVVISDWLKQESEALQFANLEVTELFDVLQRVYRCPSELLDRNDALDAIMTVYVQYLKAKGQA